MSPHQSRLSTPLVWVLAAGYSAVILGAGLWVSIATGNWFAVLLAIGLTAPVEVLLLSRYRRRAGDDRSSSGISVRRPAVSMTPSKDASPPAS